MVGFCERWLYFKVNLLIIHSSLQSARLHLASMHLSMKSQLYDQLIVVQCPYGYHGDHMETQIWVNTGLGKGLTHWGRATHICVGKLTTIASDNGLSPRRRQAIIWTNAGILLIGSFGTNFSEILIGIQIFSLKKMHLKMASAKWRPSCLGLNVLMAPSHYLNWCWLIINGVLWQQSKTDITGSIQYINLLTEFEKYIYKIIYTSQGTMS